MLRHHHFDGQERDIKEAEKTLEVARRRKPDAALFTLRLDSKEVGGHGERLTAEPDEIGRRRLQVYGM